MQTLSFNNSISYQPAYSGKSHLNHGYLGGLAGLFMDSVLHPVDTIRTRIKTNAHETVKLLTQVNRMYKHEGLFSYFKGFSCTLAGSFIANGTFFFTYEKLKHTLAKVPALHHDAVPFIAAFTAGMCSNSIYLPFIAIRTRMQINSSHYDYKHFFDGAKKVLKREGFRKLYLGGPVFFVQSAIDTSLTFGFYEIFHRILSPFFASDKDLNLPLSMISSVGAASMSAVAVNPLDVLVARMQTMHTSAEGACSIPRMIKRIYTQEGLRGFMKGVSGTMFHFSMSALILFPTYEGLKGAYNVDSDF